MDHGLCPGFVLRGFVAKWKHRFKYIKKKYIAVLCKSSPFFGCSYFHNVVFNFFPLNVACTSISFSTKVTLFHLGLGLASVRIKAPKTCIICLGGCTVLRKALFAT